MNKYQDQINYLLGVIDKGMLETNKYIKSVGCLIEAVEKANKYDDKETPKSLASKFDRKKGYTTLSCPRCNQEFIKIHKNVEETIPDIPYCWNCGQKLDWSI